MRITSDPVPAALPDTTTDETDPLVASAMGDAFAMLLAALAPTLAPTLVVAEDDGFSGSEGVTSEVIGSAIPSVPSPITADAWVAVLAPEASEIAPETPIPIAVPDLATAAGADTDVVATPAVVTPADTDAVDTATVAALAAPAPTVPPVDVVAADDAATIASARAVEAASLSDVTVPANLATVGDESATGGDDAPADAPTFALPVDGPRPPIEAAATASADEAAPVVSTPPASPGEQIARVVRATRPDGTGIQRVELELRPPELGQVTVELKLQGDELHVTMIASGSDAAEALRADLDRLRSEFGTVDLRTLNVLDSQARQFDPRSAGGDRQFHEPAATPLPATAPDREPRNLVAAAGSPDPSTSLDLRI